MNNELKEKIEQLVSYYKHHDMYKMIDDDNLRGFVVDDFTNLLKELEKAV